MILYRVFPYLASAADSNEQGHPEYLHRPQTEGRLDNPGLYDAWYLAHEPSGAIGEVFGDLKDWTEDMFDFPRLPGSRRCLGLYSVDDGAAFLDLDDARNLLERGLRPTQVIERNRTATSKWAKDIWLEGRESGVRTWDGVRWWSYHRPQWRVVCTWGQQPEVIDVHPLDLDNSHLLDASVALAKKIVRRPDGC